MAARGPYDIAVRPSAGKCRVVWFCLLRYLAFLVSCFVLLCGKSGLDRTLTCVIPAVGGAIGIFAFLNAFGHGIFLAPLPFFSMLPVRL